jgi:hypothetical protein
LPALQQWQFPPDEAARIQRTVLSVQGAESGMVTSIFPEAHRLLLDWLSNAQEYVLPNATHCLQMMIPQNVAVATATFCARHVIQVAKEQNI